MNSVAGCSSLQKSSAVYSVWNLVACVGNRRNSAQRRRRNRLLSDAARNEWLRTGVVFGASNFHFLSSISVPFGIKCRCGKQSAKIFSSSWVFLDWEGESRPDMFSIFTSKAKGVEVGGVKELENGDAKAERAKKEEEQRKRDEAAENLRKEKEIEAKIGPPPEKPLPGDCCGNGCTPCVWDTYGEELADYKKLRESIEKPQ